MSSPPRRKEPMTDRVRTSDMDMQLPPVALTLTILRLTVVQTLLLDLNGANHNALLVRVLVTATMRKIVKMLTAHWSQKGLRQKRAKNANVNKQAFSHGYLSLLE